MLFLDAISSIYTQKFINWPIITQFFLKEKVCKRMLSIRLQAFWKREMIKNKCSRYIFLKDYYKV